MRDDEKQAFELAQIGAAMGCAHSKGVLAFSALKLRAARILRKGLRLRGGALRQAAASASMFSEDVTKQDGGVA